MPARRFAFPAGTLEFLADLGAHNTREWFDANRSRYQACYLEPAAALVDTIAPALRELAPGIAAEARVNGSIFRINRDVRFSRDKTPYKDHLDLWFWEGERRTALSGLYLRIATSAVTVGAGSHGFDRPRLARYRAAVADAGTGAELAAIVDRLEGAGHVVGGQTYARTPSGFDVGAGQARLLRHGALYVDDELAPSIATSTELVPTLLRHWRAFLPLHRWLVANVAEPAAESPRR